MVKRLLSTLSVFLLCLLINAQVTTEPAFIPKDHAGEIIVKFNPAEGNGDMVGATACYAHTGVITAKSKDGSDWKYANKTWRGGEDKYKMTKEGDVWVLRIPELYSFYGCPETEEILKLAFVFNDGPNGDKEGKTEEGKDIFIDLVEPGLNVKFTNPVGNALIEKGSAIDFKINTSSEATIVLSINDKSLTHSKGTELTYNYTFAETGNYTCVAKANNDNESKSDTVVVCVIDKPINEARDRKSVV